MAQQDSVAIKFSPEDSTRIKVTRLNFNSTKSDFSPVVLNNMLLFTSGRENRVGVKYSTINNDSELTDLFSVTKKDSVSFINVNALASDINTKFSEGPFTFSKDGNTIYFTGNQKSFVKGSEQKNLLKIYKSQKINKQWSKPVLAEFCKGNYSFAHPCFSADGNTIYFSANLPNGFGGMDLYSSTFQNSEWSTPVNVGSQINTSANEVFPFCSSNNVLYFSSSRSSGIGGLDVYLIDLKESKNNTALLMEYPINTVYDDFGIWVDSSETSGYFSTNRIAQYSDDIYYFTKNIPDFSKAPTPVFKTKFCYTFFEETAIQIEDTTSLAYEWNFGDGTKSKELRSRHCFNKPGTYLIALNSVEKATGEVIANEVNYELVIDEPPKIFVNSPDTIKAGTEMILNSDKCALKDYDLTTIYWNFGDGKYNSGTHVKHTYKNAGTYTICLGVIAKSTITQKTEPFKVEQQITVIK